ncbi:DNRLRE domain-containing protein [Nonomuraea africana]|uniref:DNRLRE domain-containing protein n=1 Tax=Nonomuraea africana TaxID=46171 RepID=UPI0033DF0E21
MSTSRRLRRSRLLATALAVLLPVTMMTAAPAAADPSDPTPTTHVTDPELKAAWEKAAKTGQPVEVPSRFTETMKVWADPGGKNLRAQLHTRPIHLKNKTSGAWEPVDTRIVARDGKLQAARVKTLLTFGERGTKQLVSAAEKQGKVGLGVTRGLPEPKISGNTITYPDAVAAGADLVVLALADGFVSQVVFRRKPDGPVTVRLPLTLPKGTVFGKSSEGLPQLKDAKGEAKAAPVVLTAMDAKVEASPEEGKSSPVTASVETSGKTSELVFTPDATFLADPAVAYPVTIAAASEWFGGGVPTDAWVSKNSPSSNNAAAGWLRAGTTQTSADIARVYLKFNTEAPELEGATVIDADLYVWNYKSGGPNGQLCGEIGSGIVASRVTSPWTLDGTSTNLSWSNQPSSSGTEGGNKYGYNYEAPAGSWCAKEEALVHRVTGMARAWIEQKVPNHGLLLRAVTESPAINWRQYYASEYGGGSPYPGYRHPPTLMVEYTPAPPRRRETVVIATPELLGTFPEYEEAIRRSMYTPENFSEVASVGLSPEIAGKVEMQRDGQPYFVGTDKLDIPEQPVEDGEPTDPDGEDTLAPRVVGQEPAMNATDVPLDAKAQVTFSEPIGGAVVALKTSQGTAITGTLVRDATNKIVTFTPQEQLKPATTYTVEISGAIDSWENEMTPYTWSFRTVDQAAARWTFDEGDGRTAGDSSGNDHVASLNDTAAWIVGKSGSAVSNTPSQAQIAASQAAAKQGKAVEVADETTATSITYAQPDGKSFKTEVTAGPVRTRQNGRWVPIDTTLAGQGGKLRPKALVEGTVVEVSTGGTDPFVKMSADGKSYALRWPTPLPKPTVKGGVVTYTDAAGAGADLVVTVLPTGFRHDVVLRERPSKPLELRIGVESDGLTLSEGKGGRLLLTGKDKKLVASAPQPIMWDGSAKGRLPLAKHAVIDTQVVAKAGRTELVLKPDHAFLSDPKTVYPVRVDPTTTLPVNNDLSVLSTDTVDSPAYPTSNAMAVGVQTGQTMRALLRFDTSSLVGKAVTDAKLSMAIVDSSACGAAVGQGVQAARVTGAWDENNLYWANKPAFTTEDAQINKAAIDCTSTQTPTEWNITGISQDWAAGAANHGLVLKAPTENRAIEWRQYASSEGTEWNAPPKLVVTTSAPASSPTVANLTISPAQDVAGTTVTSSLSPQLAATVADTAGGNLTGEFEVEHDPAATGQGTGQIWAGISPAVTSGGRATVSIPTGKLTDGWKVRWRARAVNPTATTTSAWSSWQTATVDVPNPTVGAFQVTPSQVVDGVTVTASVTPTLHTTVTDPAAQPVRAEFEVEHDPAATGQGTGQIWTGAVDDVASGSQAALAVPDGKLTDGWKVRWRVRAVNTATTVGSPWSDWQALTVDVPDPVSEPSVGALQVTPSEQVDGTTVTPTLTPALLAQVSDPASKPLRAEVEVEHDPAAPAGQGSGQIWTGGADNVPAGTQATIAVPADKLADGWKVRWRARAVSAAAASAWSDWQSFTVSLPKPTASGLTVTPSKVVDGVTVTDTLTPTLQATVTHPTGQALRAEAVIEHDPAATGQGTGQIWTGAVDNVASGTQANIAVPAGKLTDGWKVRWRLRAVVGETASAWSDWRQVTVDVTQPGEEPLAQTAGPVVRTDQSFTAAAWLRWNDKDGDYTVLEQKGTHQAPFRLGNTSDHGLVFTFTSADTTGATVEGVLSDVEPPVGEWFHLAGVYNATAKTASLYLNGTLLKSTPVSFATWNASTAMALGSRMKGDLDEVQIYQRSLDAAEITAFLTSPAVQVPQNEKSSAPPSSAVAAASYNFNYEHINLQDCKDTAGFDYKYFQARIQHKPYVSCWSAYLYVQDFEEDPISRTMKKSATRSNIYAYLMKEFGSAIFEDDDQFRFRATWVVHSYLGDKSGNSIHPTPTADLKPQDMKLFTRLDEVAVEDSTGRVKLASSQLKGLNLGLNVELQTKEANTDCKVRSGSTQIKDVSAWHTDPDDVFIIRASATSPDATPNCIIKPMVAVYDDPVEPSWFYLWSQYVKDENGYERGIRRKGDTSNGTGLQYAPYFRCDFKTFRSTAGWRTGGCINPTAARIFEMSKSEDKEFIEVIQHIEDALNPATNKYSFPPLREEGHDWDKPSYPPAKIEIGTRKAKVIPGNWNVTGSDPLVRGSKGTDDINRAHWSDLDMHMDVGTDREKHWLKDKGTNYCKYYFSEKYPQQTDPNYPAPAPWMNCDEYPFASTIQGAASAKGHYSLRAVNAKQNRDQGNALLAFYAHYRVGSYNPFWVAIVD